MIEKYVEPVVTIIIALRRVSFVAVVRLVSTMGVLLATWIIVRNGAGNEK